MNQCTKAGNPIITASNFCPNCGKKTNIPSSLKPPFALPSELLNNQQTIVNALTGAQATRFDPGDWFGYLPAHSGFVGNLGISTPNVAYYKLLSRNDLTIMSKNLIGGKGSTLELFIASQIWGWGTAGRGMSLTQKAVENADILQILDNVVTLVKQRNIAAAYTTMNIKYCGAAYISKFLYFVALGANISPLPVILDGRVLNSLIQIGAHEGWTANIFADFSANSDGNVNVRENPAKYVAYVEQMDSWAKALGCAADYIEYYLWSEG
jgi:hypothetical protein